MQAPCEASWPKLSLALSGEGLLRTIEAATRDELAYEVQQAGFCVAAPGERAVAQARVEWPASGPLTLSIASVGTQTVRQLSRTLDVSALPPDGWPLAVGASLGELLREARRELPALGGAPEERAPSWAVGLAVSGELYSGGQTHGGLEVFGRFSLTPRLALEPSVGFRLGLVTPAPSGEVAASFFGGALHLVVDLLSFSRFVLSAVGGARVGLVRFEGRAREPATGAVASSWVTTARAGLELRLVRPPLLSWLRVMLGAPLVGAAASEGGTRLTAMSGVEGGASVAVGGTW